MCYSYDLNIGDSTMKNLIKMAMSEVKKIAAGITEAKDHFSGVKPLPEKISFSNKVDMTKLKTITTKQK